MKITVEEIVEQIKIMLKDEFEASVENKANQITLMFINKQRFSLSISEINR